MSEPLDIVVLGLSLSSSWGNGHATTYRALLRGLHRLGHRVLFLEREAPWYAGNRDLPDPDFCTLEFYDDVRSLQSIHRDRIAKADAVIVGSYLPDGRAVLDIVRAAAGGILAFYDIDTPVTIAALARGDCAYLDASQIPGLDLYLSFTAGPALDVLGGRFGARAAHPLHCSVDERRYVPTGVPIRWDLGYLGTYSPDRQPSLERLLIEPARRCPGRRFVVAGPQYPAGIIWPRNVERIEHLAPADHADFYSAMRTTLNVTRADMIATGWSPSVRLFEAAACGTPIISDRWPGLTDLFANGDAIMIADDTDDVTGILSTVQDDACARMAAIARRIVLDRHTGSARAGELIGLLTGVSEQRPREMLDG